VKYLGTKGVRCIPLMVLALGACSRPADKAQRRLPAVVLVDPEDGNESLPEQEPNDQRKNAQKLEPGQQLSGHIRSVKDVDWFAVEAAQEGVLRARLRGGEADLVLEAFDAAGKRLVRVASGGAAEGEVLPNLAVTKGRFFLRVALQGEKGAPSSYQLSFEVRSAEGGEEREPNWKKELASPLTIGDDAVGFLGWRNDSDWYRVELGSAPRGAIRAEMEGVDGVWPILELRDSRGKLIQRRRGRAGATVVLANILRPDESEVYLVVRTLRTFNVEARYSVRIFVEPAIPGEQEPNDRASQASWLVENVAAAGVLGDTYDRDYFALRVTKETLVWIEVSPSFRLDLAVAVANSKGEPMIEVNGAGPGAREVLPAVIARPPQLLLRLRAPKAGGVDAAGRYRLKVWTRALVGFEQEPNDKVTLASPLLPLANGAVSGFVHHEKDVDFYRLVAASDRLQVQITSPPEVEVKVSVSQGGGKPLASRKGKGELMLLAQVSAGQTYLLRVEGVKGSDTKRPYQLKLMEGPKPLAIPPSPSNKEIP